MKRILYTRPDGGTSFVAPVLREGETEDEAIERALSRAVPEDATDVQVVDERDIPPDPPQPRIVAADVFRDRFTDAELVTTMRTANTDDDVAVFWVKAITTDGTVNLDSPTVDAGLDLLTAKGLLAAGRKAEILA